MIAPDCSTPLDHYIPQVHLRKFYSSALGDRMYAIRKSDLGCFTPNSRVVCAINDGSTNAYLREDRAIEEFLKTVEPRYNTALAKLAAKNVDHECIYTIAGFVAYVITCSPAGMRIHSGPLKSSAETVATMVDARGLIPSPPPELGGTPLTELLRSGAVKITVDPKYPQALGINSILKLTAGLGNYKWEILHNSFDESPFFTSDFPAAVEQSDDPRVLNRIVPLAPNLALRILPDLAFDKSKADFAFANFGYCSRKASRDQVVRLNRLIVQCAEEMIFYTEDRPWVQSFIAKHRKYRIEPYTHEFPTQNGKLLFSTQRIVNSSGLR